MKGKIKPTAGILFILSVLIPSLFLGYFAFRSIDMEEAYIEKQFKETFLADVVYTSSVINTELDKIEDELNTVFHSIDDENIKNKSSSLINETATVGIPFLLSADFSILWPDEAETLTKKEYDFLAYNDEFLTDKISIPVYRNIAVAYKDIIINEQALNEDASADNSSIRKNTEWDPDENEIDSLNEELKIQNAQIQFEQDEEVRNRVYEQAVEEGNELVSRNILEYEQKQKKEKNPESIFISKLLSFSEIIKEKKSGFIPRIIDDHLTLFYWLKTSSGNITGCVLDDAAVKNRILGCIRNMYTSVRILTILDENGIPLIVPEENQRRDWRVPFASREINEVLPRWEVAAYLTDPGFISSKAETTAGVMWILIFILIVSIAAGGIIILKSFYAEIILAQQRTTFVSNVSHELKTPLTSIRLFAEMLSEERQPDKNRQKKYLGLMVSEIERLSRLINNVLDFSKTGQKKKQYTMEKSDIVHLCRELLESQRIRLEQKGFSVKFVTSVESIYSHVDQGALKQTLLNLIANAEKYSKDRLVIVMEITQYSDNVCIYIRDKGIGIPLKYSKKIFRKFFRVDDSLTSRVRGSGLGLTIAKTIIEDHNGSIQYIPDKEGGSVFKITLPAIKQGGRCE